MNSSETINPWKFKTVNQPTHVDWNFLAMSLYWFDLLSYDYCRLCSMPFCKYLSIFKIVIFFFTRFDAFYLRSFCLQHQFNDHMLFTVFGAFFVKIVQLFTSIFSRWLMHHIAQWQRLDIFFMNKKTRNILWICARWQCDRSKCYSYRLR